MTGRYNFPVYALFRLAWRNLWRNHRRTLIMLSAVTTAIWAMLFMISLMRGMVDQMVKDGIKALPGHVQVHNSLYPDDPSVENSLEPPSPAFVASMNNPAVVAWASRVRVPAMATSERDNRGIILLGVDPAAEKALGFDTHDIIAGRFLNGPSDPGIVVGQKLVQRLETRLGNRLVIMSQDPKNNVAERGFRIVGVYRNRLEGLEERFVYAGRDVVQNLLHLGHKISEIAVLGHDFRNTDSLERLVRAHAPPGSVIQSWQTLDAYLAAMVKVMDGFILVWIIVIFMAMSFGLVNTLMMAVFERIREIGLMLALGMRPGLIVCQVMIESMLLLGLGLLAGTALAIATVLPLRSGIDISAVSQGMELMGAASVLFPKLSMHDVLLSNGVVLVLGLLTSLMPAWRASKYRPVEAITKI